MQKTVKSRIFFREDFAASFNLSYLDVQSSFNMTKQMLMDRNPDMLVVDTKECRWVIKKEYIVSIKELYLVEGKEVKAKSPKKISDLPNKLEDPDQVKDGIDVPRDIDGY